jgi:pyruvate/2-oxoglutarate dehydrogenase complex dihydrolipoamide dehydrogenase (E3) component
VSVNMAQVTARKQKIVESFRKGGQDRLEKTENLDLIFGEASFIDREHMSIALNDGGSRELTSKKIIINTGGSPALPPIPGIDVAPVCDSTSIMELTHLPEHLLVLGGGYVALEFGQMFRRFGAKVSIVEMADRLVAREDPDVSEAVEQILREDGIEIYLGAKANKVDTASDGKMQLSMRTDGKEKTLSGSHLLVAVGRKPNTEELNLKAAGVATDDQGYIKTNDKLETNVAGVYAMGDVHGGPAFTHISYDDYRVLKENLLNGGNATIRGRLVPNTTFIDPQLASVGLNETEARKQNRNVRVAKLPMTHVARALEVSEARGFMKAIVDADSGQILGCTIFGIEGGEVMSMLQIAMMGNIHYKKIKEAIFAHPTLAESLNNLFLTLD